MGLGSREVVFCGFQQFIPELQESDITEIDVFFCYLDWLALSNNKRFRNPGNLFCRFKFLPNLCKSLSSAWTSSSEPYYTFKIRGKRRWEKKKHILKDKYGIKLG